MHSAISQVNVNVPFDGRRILLQAIISTLVACILLVLLFMQNQAEARPILYMLLLISALVVCVLSVYFWSSYNLTKRSMLSINAEFISWVNKHKNARVKWSFIRTVNIVDLSKKLGRSKYVVYDFVLDARESKMPSPMTLYARDYKISHPELLELIEQAAKTYNFQVILERI